MIMPPQLPGSGSLGVKATQFVVLLGPEDGSRPLLAHEREDLYPVSITRTSGSRRDEVVSIAYRDQERLVDTEIPLGQKRQVEVRALDDKGKPTLVMGWGTVVRQPMKIDDQNELLTMEARIMDAHFGTKRATSYFIWSPGFDVNHELREINRPIVFNPEIDGEIVGNRNPLYARKQFFYPAISVGIDPEEKPWIWVDHESIETPGARVAQEIDEWVDYRGHDPGQGSRRVQNGIWPDNLWTLGQAVHALCWLLNPGQEYITNPTAIEANSVDVLTPISDLGIRNTVIPFGASLPEALDHLLAPHSVGWYLEHSLFFEDEFDTEGTRVTQIRFFERGRGERTVALMQRPGQKRDPRETTVTSFDAEFSTMDLANRVDVWGDIEKKELTLDLKKGWDIKFDKTPSFDLKIGGKIWKKNPEVGRLWVFNEDGSYSGLRPSISGVGYLDVFDEFPDNEWIGGTKLAARRRRFSPCISTHGVGDDTLSNGYVLEYWDKSTDKWLVAKWPHQILEKQLGVVFTGENVPDVLWRHIVSGHAQDAKLRITAVVAGDNRISRSASPESSASGLTLPVVLDMHDKFQLAQVADQTVFTNKPAIQANDAALAADYAARVLALENKVKVEAGIELEGCLHPYYHIGDVVQRIAGRNITMQDPGANTSPQIMGFRIHCQAQRLELLMETFKKERPQVVNPHLKQTTDPWEKMQAQATGNWGNAQGKKKPQIIP